jgi:hypothetical protein
MNKMKKTEYEEVNAYPSVGMFNHIEIQGEDTPIKIGGFCIGGFYLEAPYLLREEKTRNFSSDDVTYYTIVRDKELQSEREKKIREYKANQEKEKIGWRENRIKEIKEELERYEKEKSGETNQKGGELK